MKRSPLRRGKPLRRVSKKRRKQNTLYAVLRREYLSANPVCEVCQKTKATDIHHKAGRAGRYLNENTLWAAVCRSCHEHIHRHPMLARKAGWIV